ncbi:MAG: hypothetical protein WA777_00880 [Rhodanobacter sp.]
MLIESPRDAAARAFVYRRDRRDEPRDRLLRVAAMVGTMLVHLIFLLGAILGSPYDEGVRPQEPHGQALQVRLIENKPQPPPPPPVRGTPPKERGPSHRGNTSVAQLTHHAQSASAPAAAERTPPIPTPVIDVPVVALAPQPSAPKPQATAAPRPPVSVPKPAPAPQIQPIPISPPPPTVALQAPPTPQPVPPKFQPEPVRKAQLEGTQAMPPPASLALPELPAQSAPKISAPTIAMEHAVQTSTAPPSVAAVASHETPAAPPVPEMQAVPLPAQPAPAVNLQSVSNIAAPSVSRVQPQIQVQTIRAAEAQLTAVPLPTAAATPPTERPKAPALAIQAPKITTSQVTIQQQASVTPEAASQPIETKPAEQPVSSQIAKSTPANNTPASNEASNESSSASATSAVESNRSNEATTAPNATAQGSENAVPGEPNGVTASPSPAGQTGGHISPTQGQGSTAGAQGNPSTGLAGTYIQLRPHGDTDIMSHSVPGARYKATRFDQYWTPEGESSIDTALRRAVEKTTVKHTFNLPRGVRIQCVVMPLFPMMALGCNSADPPPKAQGPETYKRLNQPSLNASLPTLPPPATASTAAAAAPIVLDNSVQCAEARVAGGPPPPGCASLDAVKPLPARSPASSSSAWVPASDQFH